MRLILVSEHRRWQAHLDRVAATIPTIEEETECQLLRDAENLGESFIVTCSQKKNILLTWVLHRLLGISGGSRQGARGYLVSARHYS